MSFKNITVIGLNHNSSPIELREAVSFNLPQRKEFLELLKKRYSGMEFVVLSTCNRVELYTGGLSENKVIGDIVTFFSAFHNISREEVTPYLYTYNNSDAVRHLFDVCSGLDSLVIGETQILGQVKDSYKLSMDMDSTGKTLNSIFQKAFAIGKKVRTQTKINEGNISISSIACQLAEEVMGDFKDRRALLIGMGKIGKMTLKSLQDKGTVKILLSNRSNEKAHQLAREFDGIAVELDEIEGALQGVDVVIASTSSPNYLIDLKMINRIMKKRIGQQMFLIDLAVPRDIDPKIGNVSDVHLYNVDSLKNIANKNLAKREEEVVRCKQIISEFIKNLRDKNEEYKFCKTL